MPRGIGRPKGRKSMLNPLTHGGNRLEVRQRKEPNRTARAAQKKADKRAVKLITSSKLKTQSRSSS